MPLFNSYIVAVSFIGGGNLSIRRKPPVKRHLRPSNPQLTPPTLQIQYCYSLIILLYVVKPANVVVSIQRTPFSWFGLFWFMVFQAI